MPNVTIHVNAQTTEVVGDGQKMTGLRYKDRVSGAEHQLTWRASSSRSAPCPTPSSSRARWS